MRSGCLPWKSGAYAQKAWGLLGGEQGGGLGPSEKLIGLACPTSSREGSFSRIYWWLKAVLVALLV